MSFIDKLKAETQEEIPDAELISIHSNFINELHAEDERQERKQAEIQHAINIAKRKIENIANCGIFTKAEFNPATGKGGVSPKFCNNWRECKKCRTKRAKFELTNMINNLGNREVVMIAGLSDAERKKQIRKAGKDNCKIYPQADGTNLLIVDADKINRSLLEQKGYVVEEVSLAEMIDWDWETIVNTPEGKGISGKLLTPATPSSEEKFEFIPNLVVTTNAPQMQVEEMSKEAEMKTSFLNPDDAKSVRKALAKRTQMLAKLLRNAGHSVQIETKMRKLILSEIAWNTVNVEFSLYNKRGSKHRENMTLSI